MSVVGSVVVKQGGVRLFLGRATCKKGRASTTNTGSIDPAKQTPH